MAKHDFEIADFFMIRTPLLPFQEFSNLVPSGIEVSRSQVRTVVRNMFQRPALSESLHVASRSLRERLDSWNPASSSTKDRKIGIALVKFLSRMAYRSTPFGLAAGVSWAPLDSGAERSSRSAVDLGPTSEYRRHCRLDMGVLARVNCDLLSSIEVRRSSRFFLNPTIVQRGDRWQYMEAVGAARRFQLSEVECTSYLDALFELLSRRPAVLFEELVREIRRLCPDTSDEDARQFVDLLIEQGLLLSNFEPRLTLGDPLTQFLSEHGTNNTSVTFAQLRRTHELCSGLNSLPPGEGSDLVKSVESEIRLGLNQPNTRDLLQTDLHKPVRSARLAPQLIEDISAGMEALLRLSPRTPAVLEQFKLDFLRRYHDVEVPLLEVLDPDGGLGFGPVIENFPLLEGTKRFTRAETLKPAAPEELAVSRMLFREFERSTRDGSPEIVLDDASLGALSELGEPRVPDSFYVIASMLPGEDATGRGDRVAIKSAGQQAAALFGRFCTADDGLAERVRGLIRREEALRPEVTCAEIVHLPDGRFGNVISRPPLRNREIPIYGRASVPPSDQILLRDLLVSVKNDRVLLRSARTGEFIVPKLTSAHNTNYFSTPVYRFLGVLPLQDGLLQPFIWPAEFLTAKHLPRIVYRRCVLSLRRWNLSPADLSCFRSDNKEQASDRIAALRVELGWPRFIELVRGNIGMCVDLDNPISVDCLTSEMARESTIAVREAVIPGTTPLVRGPEGAFCHELLIPFIRARSAASDRRVPSLAIGTPVSRQRRQVLPGEDWLYLKIYSGPASLERILTSHLPSLLELLAAHRVLTKWFFVRYRDPDPHLRIRLQGDPTTLWEGGFRHISGFLQNLREKLLADRACIDTYDPEVERYGGPMAFPLSEHIFHVDSECVLNLIRGKHLDDPTERWKCALYAVDRFWSVAHADEDTRRLLYQECAGDMRRGQDRSEVAREILNQRFRDHRCELEQLLFGQTASSSVHVIVHDRTVKLIPMLQRLKQLEKAGLSRTFGQIIRSHVHMSVNRLCLDFGRAQEAAIYDLLARLYKARRARSLMSAGTAP